MWIFYFLLWTAVKANEEPLYRKISDNVVLRPDSVVNPITNIRWKHGPNIAMQWNGDEILSYRQFKDRGSLDISTGVMTITGLTRDHSGIYTAEINGKETSETQLQVISPVPKPTLYASCDTEITYCVLTCSGNITGAEPVTYRWAAGEKRWNSTDKHKITKEEKEQWFNCTLENPVSSNSSEKVINPFITYRTWTTVIPVVVLSILVVCSIIIIIIIIICLKRKYRKGFKPQWQFERKSGGWRDFRKTTDSPNERSVTSDYIEKQKTHDKISFTMNRDEYELDFKAMTLTNLETKTKRKVRRVMVKPELDYIEVSRSYSLFKCYSCH